MNTAPEGMTLRDYFAGAALQGASCFFGQEWDKRDLWDAALIARQAAKIADAMLAELAATATPKTATTAPARKGADPEEWPEDLRVRETV